MITSKYDWQLASPSADEAFLALAKKAGLEASVATLLYERGIQTKEDLEDFLEPKLGFSRPLFAPRYGESSGAHPTGH